LPPPERDPERRAPALLRAPFRPVPGGPGRLALLRTFVRQSAFHVADRIASVRPPYAACLIVGLGGLFFGVTGPLLSTFVPLLVRDALGDQRTLIGLVMAIDNVLLLLLVPWAGAASDRATARGGGRLPIILTGLLLASAGMAVFPWSPQAGLIGIIGATVLLYGGINLLRSPFQAVIADLVPSKYRSLATGSVTFQMCVGAIVFLMLGRMLGMRTAFTIAAATVLLIALVFAIRLGEPRAAPDGERGDTQAVGSLIGAVLSAVRGAVPGLRAIFIAALLVQLTFQSFTTWYALHAVERFGIAPGDVTIGFIAWALGGVFGALPAGALGVRIGRRNAMVAGFLLMAASLVALDRVTEMRHAIPLLALASAAWTFPTVNAYPLFIEQIPRQRRGVLAALFLLSMALGGGIGDPLNGALFDLFASYRPLFLMMAGYTALAFVAVLFVPAGVGEADTGLESAAAPATTV
jgi:MFS family permease